MTHSPPRRAFLVDDHPVVRLGLVHLVDASPEWSVVGQAGSAEEALEAIDEGVDVVVTDLRMPGLDGLALTRLLKVRRPDLPVVLLSSFDEGLFAEQALEAGASGFMMKDVDGVKLRRAMEGVALGQVVLSPSMWDQLLPHRPSLEGADEELVAALGGVPTSDQQVARRLGITRRELIRRRRACLEHVGLTSELQLTLLVHWWELQAA